MRARPTTRYSAIYIRANYIQCYRETLMKGGIPMAYIEVIRTSEAAQILGCSTVTVTKLIRDGVITTAFMRDADGHVGPPGWGMYRHEIVQLAEDGKWRKRKRAKKNETEIVKPVETKSNRENVIKALEDLEACLGLLTETIGKLRESL